MIVFMIILFLILTAHLEVLSRKKEHSEISPHVISRFVWVCFDLSFQYNSPFGKAEAYEKLEQLGEGSYATVFKGKSK